MTTAGFAHSLLGDLGQSISYSKRAEEIQTPNSLSEGDLPNRVLHPYLTVANTSSIGVIEVTVSSLKGEIKQFIERYTEFSPNESDVDLFAPASIKPNTVRKVLLHVKKSGLGKPTVAFQMEDLIDEEFIEAF